ncbi:hypothetical protein B0H13DRAFT_1959021 [Mycena leptocephala]|nr:hypothetical protein B0H13DRAFT_1959021 [Mycena leptocephala]
MALLRVLRASGIPVPEVVFFCSDPHNPLQYEYNCLKRIAYPSLADTWMTLSPVQLDRILDQFVEIFIKLWELDVPTNHGSLRLDGSSGPVIEETMWTLPDIARYFHAPPYNLTSETFATLNPTDFYTSWPAYICGFLRSYAHIIAIHPAVAFLHDLLPPLSRLIALLESEPAQMGWVQRLRDAPELGGRLFHRDFHFGNILADSEGTIKAVIDWEFAGIGVCLLLSALLPSLSFSLGAMVMVINVCCSPPSPRALPSSATPSATCLTAICPPPAPPRPIPKPKPMPRPSWTPGNHLSIRALLSAHQPSLHNGRWRRIRIRCQSFVPWLHSI